MEIPKQLHDEIWDFCRLNSITNIDDFIQKCLKKGFHVNKYGATPSQPQKTIEKIVEVPVEKIVEKIVEVPITVTDEEANKKLAQALLELEEANNKIKSLTEELKKIKSKKDIYGE
jgi:hypothetical protein